MRQTLVGVFPEVDHRRAIPKKVHLYHASPDRGHTFLSKYIFLRVHHRTGMDASITPLCQERVVFNFDTQR